MAQLIFDEEKVTSVIDRIVKRTFQMDFAWDWPGGVAFMAWRRRMKRQKTRNISIC